MDAFKMIGYDKVGRPIVIFRIKNYQPSKSTDAKLSKYLTYTID